MKSIIAVMLMVLSSAAAAGRLAPPDNNRVIITGQRATTPYEQAEPASVTIADGAVVHAKLAEDGTLELGHGATVDFADTKPFAGNPVPMYVVVRVQGKKYLMPLYEYVE